MRINVYSQELTSDVELVETTADTGISYYGVRLFLHSPDLLHHTPEDDDRSAVTFWIPNAKSMSKDDFANTLRRMASLVQHAPDVPEND